MQNCLISRGMTNRPICNVTIKYNDTILMTQSKEKYQVNSRNRIGELSQYNQLTNPSSCIRRKDHAIHQTYHPHHSTWPIIDQEFSSTSLKELLKNQLINRLPCRLRIPRNRNQLKHPVQLHGLQAFQPVNLRLPKPPFTLLLKTPKLPKPNLPKSLIAKIADCQNPRLPKSPGFRHH